MNYSIFGVSLPELKISYEDLTIIVTDWLKNRTGFQLNNLYIHVASYVVKYGVGFTPQKNTQYREELTPSDVAKLRDIIWDFIILRYLTPGGNGQDGFPHVAITEKGKTYFNSLP